MAQLAPDVHVAFIRGRGVALDLSRGRYIGLAPAIAAGLQALLEPDMGADEAEASVVKDKLVGMGLIRDGAHKTPRQAQIPTSTLWPTDGPPHGRVQASCRTGAFAALTQVSLALRLRSMRDVTHWIRREHEAASLSAPADVQSLLDDYWAVRPWFFQRPICRLDAMSICLHLWRGGRDADLVFGVELDPFAAHCWVQVGESVVNEDHDGVRRYTPILVI